MSTHIYCRDCGDLLERYEDDGLVQEVLEQCDACRRADIEDESNHTATGEGES